MGLYTVYNVYIDYIKYSFQGQVVQNSIFKVVNIKNWIHTETFPPSDFV